MYFTAPDGCRLAYDEFGTGPASIVFLHGIMMDRSVFSEQVQVFAKSHRVIVPDLRGHGESCKPEAGYTLEQYVADLEFLIARLELRNPVLAGWSMGGSIAIAFAASHTGVAKKLILIGATPCLVQRTDWLQAVPPEAAQQLGQALATDYAGGAAVFCQMMFPEENAAQASARVLSVMQASTPHVTLACMNNIGGADLRPLLGSIKNPVHTICGENDAVCPLDASRHIAMVTGGSLSIIPGAGHCAFLTYPEAFSTEMMKALSVNRP